MFSGFSNMPNSMKLGVTTVGGGGLAFASHHLLGIRGLILLAVGVLLVLILLAVYGLILRQRRHKRSERLGRQIRQGIAAAPQGVNQADMIARLDDLRKKFEKGLETFNAAGKDMYSMPWYVLVGEPGSGKTEAIRNSNVGFPPGLHDEFQGAGGTINMNWWFTNSAVILDTAGRLMFEDVEAGNTSEWREFLALVRQCRPNCPVNGMVLVIPADSLIKDTAEQIEAKGAQIAQQFDTIQRSLDIRFPVFVLVTKCDLINGFREFFDDLTDPHLQHQMLGWSNPAALDEPFEVDKVSAHLATVHQRLLDRRLQLIGDRQADAAMDDHALDGLDALYAFPHSFSRIVPRLKRYLQIVFAASEWSTRPLFARGIYFTSSMREGSALDTDLADALDVSIDTLPEGRAWERDRAFFLRDVWMEKAFREKGLVTRATNARKLQRKRRLVSLAAGFSSAAIILLLTWLGAYHLHRSVGKERDFWLAAASTDWQQEDTYQSWMPLVYRDVDGTYAYGGMTRMEVGNAKVTAGAFHGALLDRTSEPFRVPMALKLSGSLVQLLDDEAGINRSRQDAHRLLFQAGVLQPLLDAAREKISTVTPQTWDPESTRALEQLIALEAAVLSPSTVSGDTAPEDVFDIDALFRYVLADNPDQYKLMRTRDGRTLTAAWQWLYAKKSRGEWAPEALSDGLQLAINTPVRTGVEAFIGSCAGLRKTADLHDQLEAFQRLETMLSETVSGLLRAHTAHEARMIKRYGADTETIESDLAYQTLKVDWDSDFGKLGASLKSLNGQAESMAALHESIPLLTGKALAGSYTETVGGSASEMEARLRSLRLPPADDAKAKSFLKRLPDEVRLFPKEDDAPTLVEEVRTRIEDEIEKLRKDQREKSGRATELKAFDQAYASFLTQLARARARQEIYTLANRELSGARAADEADTDGPGVRDLSTQAKRVRLAINRHLDPEDPRSDGAAGTAGLLASLGARARAYHTVRDMLARTPTSARALEESITLSAEAFDPIKKWLVPRTAMEAGAFDARFHPEAAAVVLGEWARLGSLVNSQDIDILERSSLSELYTQRRDIYKEYAKRFLEYWSVQVPQELRIEPLTWPEWHKRLAASKARTSIDALKALCEELQRTFTTADALADYLPRDGITDITQRAKSGMARAESRTFLGECERILANWTDLPADALAAREVVLALNPGTFSRSYLVLGSPDKPDPLVQYWEDLSYALLRALAASARADIAASLKGDKHQASAVLARMRVSDAALDAQSLAAGTAVGVNRIDEEIARLRLLDMSHEMAWRLLDRTAKTVAGVEDLVTARATSLPPVSHPAIPLTAQAAGAFDSRYHPLAAQHVYEDWKAITETINDPGLRPADRAKFERGHTDRQGAYDAYTTRFTQYWSQGLVTLLSVKGMTWSSMRRALLAGDARSSNVALADTCKAIDTAFAGARQLTDVMGADKVQAIRDMARRAAARAGQRAYATAAQRVWRQWGRLPEDPFTAREQVIGQSPTAFLKGYSLPLPEAERSDFVTYYWDSFTRSCLVALSHSTQEGLATTLAKARDYQHFPLARPQEGEPGLLPDEIVEAHAVLTRIQPDSAGGEGDTLAQGARTGNSRIDPQIDELVQIGLPAPLQAWLKSAQPVLAALPAKSGQSFTCTVRILSSAEQKVLLKGQSMTLSDNSVLPIWRVISLHQGETRVGSSKTLLRETGLLGTLRYPGPAIAFNFLKYPSDRAPDRELKLPAPWGCLRLLHAGTAIQDPADPKKWNVEVRFSVAGQTRAMWLALTFDTALPALQQWPNPEQ